MATNRNIRMASRRVLGVLIEAASVIYGIYLELAPAAMKRFLARPDFHNLYRELIVQLRKEGLPGPAQTLENWMSGGATGSEINGGYRLECRRIRNREESVRKETLMKINWMIFYLNILIGSL